MENQRSLISTVYDGNWNICEKQERPLMKFNPLKHIAQFY